MQAIVLSEFGGPEQLQFGEAPDPIDRAGWTTVRLTAAALNWHDTNARKGLYHSPLPHVIGSDGAGIAVDSGEEVVILPMLWWGDDESAPAPGWEILGDLHSGTYAEYISVPDENIVAKPVSLSWHEAAALPLVGSTTYRALVSRGRLRAGESVLVLGAGGGVATMAVALGAAVGAHVFVTSSSAGKIEQAVANGASDGVLYTNPSWPDDAKALSPGGLGFDVVLDTVGTWSDSIRALRPGGRLVVLGASKATTAELDVRAFFFGQYELIGTTMGSARDFGGLLAMVDAGTLAPPIIDHVFPLAEASAAHEYLETGATFGKVVLSIGEDLPCRLS